VARVSVIVPCYNARRWIGETLDSVVQQDFQDLEVIVVDDGSTDGSAELVRDLFPLARVLTTQRAGPSRARNLGTQLAQGDFLQYLDADDLLGPGKLKAQVAALETSGADVAYGSWCALEQTGEDRFVVGWPVNRRIDGDADVALLTDFWCPPAAYLFRRSIVARVGGWNEGLPIIQDARFALDCALHGGRFVFCDGLAAYYRRHTSGSVSTTNRPGFVRDRLRSASEVEQWWRERDLLTPKRVCALVQAYGDVARASFGRDAATFEAAYAALERLQPGYVPTSPRHLALAARFLGYRRAEAAAVWYRRAKQSLHLAGRPA
jgi:glycosyltransferase involved in cell wall biosynthesis